MNSTTDLQFSTDDEEFEEVVGDNESVAATLGQGEALARSSQPVNYIPGKLFFSYLLLDDLLSKFNVTRDLQAVIARTTVNKRQKLWSN